MKVPGSGGRGADGGVRLVPDARELAQLRLAALAVGAVVDAVDPALLQVHRRLSRGKA